MLVPRELPKGMDRFHGVLKNTSEAKKSFSSETQMGLTKDARLGHRNSIASGKFDEGYVKNARTIGAVHARIGLEPRWEIGGYGLLAEHLIHCVIQQYWPFGGVFSKKNGTAEDDCAPPAGSYSR